MHLSFSLALLTLARLVVATHCPSDQVVDGRHCKVTCNQDRPGGDFAAQYTGSFQACITACGNNAECLTAQYHEANGYCYLKNSINAAVSSNGTDSVVCSAPWTTLSTKTSWTSSSSSTTWSYTSSTCAVSTSTIVQTCTASTSLLTISPTPTTVLSIATVTATTTDTITTITTDTIAGPPYTVTIPASTKTVTQPASTVTTTAHPTTVDAQGCLDGQTKQVVTMGTDHTLTSQTYIEICSADYSNHNLEVITAPNYDSCILKCPLYPGCLGVVYNSGSLECSLKDGAAGFSQNTAFDAALLLA